MINQLYFYQFNISHLLAHSLNVKHSFLTHNWGQSGSRSNSHEDELHITQNSRTGTSPSCLLVSYPRHVKGYISAEMQSVYATTVDCNTDYLLKVASPPHHHPFCETALPTSLLCLFTIFSPVNIH